MANRSTFPTSIDAFIQNTEISASDRPLLARYQELKLKINRTPSEDDELALLTEQLRTKLMTSEDYNHMKDAISNTQTFFRDNVDGYIQTKQTEFQAEVDKFTDKGEYNPNVRYYKRNTVSLNGESYINQKESQGVAPNPDMNTLTWAKIAQKGDKGDRGASGTGLRFVGTWSQTTPYIVNDAVQFGGNIYACLKDGIGNAPRVDIDTEYWGFAVARGETIRLESLKNTVTVSNSTSTVSIGIPTYNPSTDMLTVIKNTATLAEGKNYQTALNGEAISSLEGVWNGTSYPITFHFVVTKNTLASAPFLDVLHLKFVEEEVAYSKAQSTHAKTQGDYAKIQGDLAKQTADSIKNVYLSPVANFDAVNTTHPSPVYGSRIQTIDNGRIYRWDNTLWQYIENGSINVPPETKRDTFTSTANQTVFTLSGEYIPNRYRLRVIIGQVEQFSPESFTESTSKTFTMNQPLPLGIQVIAIYTQ